MKKKILLALLVFLVSCSCFAQDTSSFADVRGNVLQNTNYNFTDFNGTVPKNTKEIIAWYSKLTEEGDTTTSKSESWHYDKNQNLTSWFEFEYYDFGPGYRILHEVHKRYDKQNRIVSLDESENGMSEWMVIFYPTKNTIIEEYGSPSVESLAKIRFDYNSKGQVVRREVSDSISRYSYAKYKKYHYVTVYKYDKKDNLMEENTFDLPALTTAQTIKYTYNQYNQILRKETNTKEGNKDIDVNTLITKYNYYGYLEKGEKKPRIFSINKTEISGSFTSAYVERYTHYEKNVLEIETIRTSTYSDESRRETYDLIYKDNKLIRKKYFSEPTRQVASKITHWIDYQYISY